MMNFVPHVQRADRFINTDERLRLLQTHVNEIKHLQKLWQTIVPSGLASVSRIGQINTDTISIYCDHGAAAAKIRQLSTSISSALTNHGIHCTTLLVKVRTQAIPNRSRTSNKPELSATALLQLENLRDQLEDGVLKIALARLLLKHQAPDAIHQPD